MINLDAAISVPLYNQRSCCHEDTDALREARLLRLLSKYLEPISGVTTRGEVRQLPQGAKRQGALWGAFGRRIVCFALQNSAEFLNRERS